MKQRIYWKTLGLLGESPAMKRLKENIEKAAPHTDTVLIQGERGTGKESVARALHRLGPYRGNGMALCDCAALAPSTMESQLYGHERGAFTGAVKQHQGIFEQAHQTSLFLDEVATLAPETQSRFLRFLEERSLRRVGGYREIRIETRIIAASNQPLARAVEAGRFLPDLFDRLNVLPIEVPPLRDRLEDLPLLVEHFWPGARERFTPDAWQALQAYPWPGNVRELRNLCRRLLVFAYDEPIHADQLDRFLARRTLTDRHASLPGEKK